MRRAARVDSNHAVIVGALRACGTCGAPTPPDSRGRSRSFCSRECVGKYVGKQPKTSDRLRHYQCNFCGAAFLSYYDNRIYCSRACTGKARLGKFMGRAYAVRIDANHQTIVNALKQAGCSIIDTSAMGGGCPDLIVCFRRVIHMLEIKNPKTSYGRKGLNENQQRFHAEWAGASIHVVQSVDEALAAVGVNSIEQA